MTVERPLIELCFTAKYAKPCYFCGLLTEQGQLIAPSEVYGRYYHYGCAEQRVQELGGPYRVATCKHWVNRGYCLRGDQCIYNHPPRSAAPPPRSPPSCSPTRSQGKVHKPRDEVAAFQGSMAGSNLHKDECRTSQERTGHRSFSKRNKVLNSWRATVLRSWLIDKFGLEKLKEGRGVLDVAGGKGALAFELVNLNRVAATVVDPRTLELGRCTRRLVNGMYHRSVTYQEYNNQYPLEDVLREGVTYPGHVRMLLTPAVVSCVRQAHVDQYADTGGAKKEGAAMVPECMCGAEEATGPPEVSSGPYAVQPCATPVTAQDSPQSGVSGPGLLEDPIPDQIAREMYSNSSGQDLPGAAGEAHVEGPRRSLVLLRDAISESMQAALGVQWTRQGLADHEGKGGFTGRRRRGARRYRDEGDAWLCGPACFEHDPDSCSGDEEDDTGEASSGGGTEQVDEHYDAPSSEEGPSQPGLPTSSTRDLLQDVSPRRGRCPSNQEDEQGKTALQQELRSDIDDIMDLLLNCSIVVGMHPDQATEPLVDLALALGKPFAVVPCCVYAVEFPWRRLESGVRVRSYDQFVEYLCHKRPPGEILCEVQPFEGRNQLIYWMGPTSA